MPNHELLTLKITKRDLVGKKVKKIRKQKQIPASIFGFKGNFNITVDLNEFIHVYKLAGHTKLITLESNSDFHKVFIDEVQSHPVTREYLHVSFREVSETEEIDMRVPVILEGVEDSPAYKEDKQLVILVTHLIEIRGKLSDLPAEIKINVSNFKAGDVLLLKDLKLPQGVKLVHTDESSLNQVIVTTTSAIIEDVVDATVSTESQNMENIASK